MHPDAPKLLPFICPACRRVSERGRELWTVSLAEVFTSEKSSGDTVDEVLEGSLRCDNPICRRLYPILDGIPLLVPDPAGVVASQPAALAAGLHPETLALLASGSTDEAALPRLLEHLSIYLDAHWGDCAEPSPDGPLPGWGGAALFGAVARRAQRPVKRALELGCSVGRGVAALRSGAELVVGVDLHLGALRIARRLLRGQPVGFARRMIGRHYQTAKLLPGTVGGTLGSTVDGTIGSTIGSVLVLADALDPPFSPHAFERVVALNLLDSVRSPPQLLSVVDGLCAQGGELLLASPYTWQSDIVEESGRIGGSDPAAALRKLLQEGKGLEARYTLEAEQELPWQLRRDARSAHSYVVHTLLMRKSPT